MASSGKGGPKKGSPQTAEKTTQKRDEVRSPQSPMITEDIPDIRSKPKRPRPLDLSEFKRKGIL